MTIALKAHVNRCDSFAALIADAAKFRVRPNANSLIYELDNGQGTYADDFTTTPFYGRMIMPIVANVGDGPEVFAWNASGYLRNRPDNSGTATGGFMIYADSQCGGKITDGAHEFTFTANHATRNFGGVCARVDLQNFNMYQAYFDGANARIRKVINGAATSLANTAFTFSASDLIHVEFTLSGTSLSAKFWKNADAKPGSPTVSVTDSSITAPGAVGCYLLGTYLAELYADSFTSNMGLATSAKYILKLDSGRAGTVWASGATDVLFNIDSYDTATGTIAEYYPAADDDLDVTDSTDQATIIANVQAAQTITAGSVSLLGGISRYRYLVLTVTGDGSQQGSFGVLDNGQSATIQEESPPSIPVLNSVVSGGYGEATASVTGAGAIYLLFRKHSGSVWQMSIDFYNGGGTGDIDVTGLDGAEYEFCAVATSGTIWSLPSNVIIEDCGIIYADFNAAMSEISFSSAGGHFAGLAADMAELSSSFSGGASGVLGATASSIIAEFDAEVDYKNDFAADMSKLAAAFAGDVSIAGSFAVALNKFTCRFRDKKYYDNLNLAIESDTYILNIENGD